MERTRHRGAMALGLCALAAGVFPAAGHAQAPTPIRVGVQAQGTLSASDPVANERGRFRVYRFDGRQGERLSIRMNSNDFDAYLSVGRTVAGITDVLKSDDDSGGETNARIRFTVPRSGEYLVVAQALESSGVGDFTLMLDTLPAPIVAAPRRIRVGQPVSGALAETDPTLSEPEEVFYDLYTLPVAAGQRVQVDMRSSDFDSYLEIGRMQGAEMEVLRFNDDAPAADSSTAESSLDSRLVFTAPTAGEYVLRARSLGPASVGSYTLTLVQLPPLRIPAPRPVSAGQTVEGTLAGDDAQNDADVHYDAYVIRGRAGETLEVTMESEDFDAFLSFGRMQGRAYEEIATNDDGESGTGSLLRVTLERDGEYVIRAQSLSPNQTGAYTLAVRGGTR